MRLLLALQVDSGALWMLVVEIQSLNVLHQSNTQPGTTRANHISTIEYPPDQAPKANNRPLFLPLVPLQLPLRPSRLFAIPIGPNLLDHEALSELYLHQTEFVQVLPVPYQFQDH